MNGYIVSYLLCIIFILLVLGGSLNNPRIAFADVINDYSNMLNRTSHNGGKTDIPLRLSRVTRIKSPSLNQACFIRRRRAKVVLSTSLTYLPILLNWFIHYYRVCPSISDTYIICLDAELENLLESYGLNCSVIASRSISRNIWFIRMETASHLLKQGYDVLLSDSDAIWLRNPYPYIQRLINFNDIISARASFPKPVGKILGATLCMGFMYVKSNAQTVHIWDGLVNGMSHQEKPDDQRFLNNYLYNTAHLHYKIRPTYENHLTTRSNAIYNVGTFLCSGAGASTANFSISVAAGSAKKHTDANTNDWWMSAGNTVFGSIFISLASTIRNVWGSHHTAGIGSNTFVATGDITQLSTGRSIKPIKSTGNYYHHYQRGTSSSSTSSSSSTMLTENCSLTLLPHDMFRRVCDTNTDAAELKKNAVVAHCLSVNGVRFSSRQTTASKIGLWVLRNDWNRTDMTGAISGGNSIWSILDRRTQSQNTSLF